VIRLSALWIVAAGCGRFGFDARDDAAGSNVLPGDGPRDGAMPDVPAFGCEVTRPTALLCEGFESPSVMWDYTTIMNGAVTRTTARSARGAASLDATTDGINDYKYARWGKNNVLPAIMSGDLYVRERMWLSSTTVVNDQLSIMVFGNLASPFPSVNLLLTPGAMTLVVYNGVHIADAATDFPRDRWVCVEVHVLVDATAGAGELFIDGSLVTSGSGLDTTVAGGYTNVDVGVHYATPNQLASEMWIDDVVADTSPIGCN